MLAVYFLVNPLLPLMDGTDMFCHVTLAREHFITMGTGNAFDSAMFGLAQVYMSNMGREVGFCGENSHAKVTSLVTALVSSWLVYFHYSRIKSIISFLLDQRILHDGRQLCHCLVCHLICRNEGGEVCESGAQ